MGVLKVSCCGTWGLTPEPLGGGSHKTLGFVNFLHGGDAEPPLRPTPGSTPSPLAQSLRFLLRDLGCLLRLQYASSGTLGLGTASWFCSAEQNTFRRSTPSRRVRRHSASRSKKNCCALFLLAVLENIRTLWDAQDAKLLKAIEIFTLLLERERQRKIGHRGADYLCCPAG